VGDRLAAPENVFRFRWKGLRVKHLEPGRLSASMTRIKAGIAFRPARQKANEQTPQEQGAAALRLQQANAPAPFAH